jgi:hypothetical protein
MKNNEKKLILDLYKHYNINYISATEISDNEINLLYNKYGDIRNILRNLIQEFEPETIITEEYLDEKLNYYGINKLDEVLVLTNERNDSSDDNKSKNKSFKNAIVIVIGIILISSVIWLLIERQKNKNEIQQKTEINDKSLTEDEEVVNTSLQNSKYGNESYEEENVENSTTVDNYSEINSSETSSQENYKAVVVIAKTYFYETPSYEKKRKAFLVEGDTIEITNEENGFLYGSFTNSNGKTTSGWIAKNDVQYFEIP